MFTTKVYAPHVSIVEIVSELNEFRSQVYGGLYDVCLGEFGPEYANGAFCARLHYQSRGKVYVSVRVQSEFKEFGNKNVASEATLYLVSETALLDRWIEELGDLAAGRQDSATLEGA